MPRRILEGEIVSDKQDKTITVLVERRYRDPMYKKYVKKTSKYAAHDPSNQYKAGERVQIIECAPISKNKRWIVLSADGQPAPEKKEEAKKAAPKKEEAKKSEPKKEAKKEEKPKAEKKETKKKAAPKKAAAKKTTKKKED